MPAKKPPQTRQHLATIQLHHDQALDAIELRMVDPSISQEPLVTLYAHLDDTSKSSVVTEELLGVLRPLLRSSLRPAFPTS